MLKQIQRTVLLVLSLVLALGAGAALFSQNTFAQTDDFDYSQFEDFSDEDFDAYYSDYDYSSSPEMDGSGLFVLICQCVLSLAIFIFTGYCFQRISIKLGREDLKYFGYIPLVNIYQLTELAGKPFWWIVLLFIPLVNIVIIILLLMEISKKAGKEGWYGILGIIPIVQLFIFWSLGNKE